MKQLIIAVVLLLACLVQRSHQQQSGCNSTTCITPGCRCMSTQNPGNFGLSSTPQLVFLSFDGAITTNQIVNYTSILNPNRVNPNGCPITATFFVYHEYNDYSLSHNLYSKGHEMASFSMSHTYPADSWASKPASVWSDEIGGMRTALSKFANIPENSIRGSRAPFLQTSGDSTFQAMKDLGMLYDISFPTTAKTNPPVWPYTMDFGIQHECSIPPCPEDSFSDVWTIPMITLTDLNGTQQSMADGYLPPTQADTYAYLLNNFNRHYSSSKAPFGIYLNANAWFNQPSTAFRLNGYTQFLDYLTNFDDVYVVSIGKGIDWMKNPVTTAQAGAQGGPFDCPNIAPTSCSARRCYYEETPLDGERSMVSCTTCPPSYPWTGNPTGELNP